MLFEHPWPIDLPSSCPVCGKELQTGINLVIGPGRAARIVKGIAYAMILPWMLFAVVLFMFSGMPNGGLGGGYAILGFMFIPSVIMAIVARILPSSRRIICNCGYRKDFPAFPSQKTDVQQDDTPGA